MLYPIQISLSHGRSRRRQGGWRVSINPFWVARFMREIFLKELSTLLSLALESLNAVLIFGNIFYMSKPGNPSHNKGEHRTQFLSSRLLRLLGNRLDNKSSLKCLDGFRLLPFLPYLWGSSSGKFVCHCKNLSLARWHCCDVQLWIQTEAKKVAAEVIPQRFVMARTFFALSCEAGGRRWLRKHFRSMIYRRLLNLLFASIWR